MYIALIFFRGIRLMLSRYALPPTASPSYSSYLLERLVTFIRSGYQTRYYSHLILPHTRLKYATSRNQRRIKISRRAGSRWPAYLAADRRACALSRSLLFVVFVSHGINCFAVTINSDITQRLNTRACRASARARGSFKNLDSQARRKLRYRPAIVVVANVTQLVRAAALALSFDTSWTRFARILKQKKKRYEYRFFIS